ncbi:unnamed protein product [Paramecium octaurelia]|uniref:Uncharacterized protein n=1 Tax=Paramecium octaurelia TaxID=43137 RepID=A0A8S1THY5_PAROT|nr:unnamed protein product [Paramecium octaurelia]
MQQTQKTYKNFKEMHSIQERQVKFKEKLSQNPEMIPIILEKHPKSQIQSLKNQFHSEFQDDSIPRYIKTHSTDFSQAIPLLSHWKLVVA